MPLDRGGFKVEDVHRTSNGQVTLSMGKISFVGGLDTAIVPSALISPLWKQLRIGIKLKQSNAQQAAWAAASKCSLFHPKWWCVVNVMIVMVLQNALVGSQQSRK